MSEKIKAGDLVIVVHQCCDRLKAVGAIKRVNAVNNETTLCRHCFDGGTRLCAHFEGTPPHVWTPLSWLKKIDPPALEEKTTTREELPA